MWLLSQLITKYDVEENSYLASLLVATLPIKGRTQRNYVAKVPNGGPPPPIWEFPVDFEISKPVYFQTMFQSILTRSRIIIITMRWQWAIAQCVISENRFKRGQLWKIIFPPIFNENLPNFEGRRINIQKIQKIDFPNIFF